MDPAHGGTTTAVRTMVGVEKALGYQSIAVTLDDPACAWRKGSGNFMVPAGPGVLSYGWSPRLQPTLDRYVAESDLVVVHGLWQYHERAARIACHLAGVPYIVYPHGMLDPWSIGHSSNKRLLKKMAFAVQTRAVLDSARFICFTSGRERELALSKFSVAGHQTRILSLAVEQPPHNNAILRDANFRTNPLLEGKRLILFLGRLHPKKACDTLVRAFVQWKAASPAARVVFHLRLVGPAESTNYLEYLQGLAAEYNRGADVSFAGMADTTTKWQELASADVLILPSYQENFGLVVGEAAACGVPSLLSTGVDIWRDVVEFGAGLAAEPTEAGVVSLLDRWEAMSEDARRMMTEAANRLYRDKMSTARMARDVQQLYSDCVNP